MQTGQELSAHAFSIHNDPLDVSKRLLLFITRNDGWQSYHQMLIPTVRGGEQGVPLFIMQEHQRATSQHCSQTSNQSSGNTGICVDGLTVAIDVAGQHALRVACFILVMLETGVP